MRLRPVGDRVIVRPNSQEEKSRGGLLFARRDDEKQDQGTIISVGSGSLVKEFKQDMKIVYQKYGPAEVTIDEEKLVIVHIDEILAVVEE